MQDVTILSFNEDTTPDFEDWVYIVKAAAGIDRDKKTKLKNLLAVANTFINQTSTATIDLSTYSGDVVIITTQSSAITLTFTNALRSSRRLSIVNNGTGKVSLSGIDGVAVEVGFTKHWQSDGSSNIEIVEQTVSNVVVSATGTLDVSAYKTDVFVLVSTPSGNTTLTISNNLLLGKKLIVYNNSPGTLTLSGVSSSITYVTGSGGTFVSGGGAWFRVYPSTIEANIINEKTSGAGVTVDDVLLKDGEVTTDRIVDPGSAGIDVDGVLLKDGEVHTETIIDDVGAGIDVDGVLLKDGEILNNVYTYYNNSSPAWSEVAQAMSDAGFKEGIYYPCNGTYVGGSVDYVMIEIAWIDDSGTKKCYLSYINITAGGQSYRSTTPPGITNMFVWIAKQPITVMT